MQYEAPEGFALALLFEKPAHPDGVFGDGVEGGAVAVEAAFHGEGVGDIADVDVFGAWGERGEFATGEGLDPAIHHGRRLYRAAERSACTTTSAPRGKEKAAPAERRWSAGSPERVSQSRPSVTARDVAGRGGGREVHLTGGEGFEFRRRGAGVHGEEFHHRSILALKLLCS